MSKPTRETSAGRAYLDLRARAKKDGRSTDELLQLYALEAFLDRLSSSTHADNFVLKGGVLLAAYDLRRPTRDVDLLARHVDAEHSTVLDLIGGILAIAKDDGCVFGKPTAENIREDDEYQGIRVRILCTLAGANVTFGVDVNIGDPVKPQPAKIKIARLLGGSITVRGYPLSMVLAEKIVTAVQRGVANTRWRDFADIYWLSGLHTLSAKQLAVSIETVATHRRAIMKPLKDTLEGFGSIAQPKWRAWVRKQQLEDRLPSEFSVVLDAIQAFTDPFIEGGASERSWEPERRRWS